MDAEVRVVQGQERRNVGSLPLEAREGKETPHKPHGHNLPPQECSPADPVWTSDLHSCKILSFSCFKPQHLQ